MKTEITELLKQDVTACINRDGRDLATVRGELRRRVMDDGYVVSDGNSFAWLEDDVAEIAGGSFNAFNPTAP